MNTEIANSSVKSKIYKWEVVSNKMENTLVVKVTSVKSHPLYKKDTHLSKNIMFTMKIVK